MELVTSHAEKGTLIPEQNHSFFRHKSESKIANSAGTSLRAKSPILQAKVCTTSSVVSFSLCNGQTPHTCHQGSNIMELVTSHAEKGTLILESKIREWLRWWVAWAVVPRCDLTSLTARSCGGEGSGKSKRASQSFRSARVKHQSPITRGRTSWSWSRRMRRKGRSFLRAKSASGWFCPVTLSLSLSFYLSLSVSLPLSQSLSLSSCCPVSLRPNPPTSLARNHALFHAPAASSTFFFSFFITPEPRVE